VIDGKSSDRHPRDQLRAVEGSGKAAAMLLPDRIAL
jgi:hypothetical protein